MPGVERSVVGLADRAARGVELVERLGQHAQALEVLHRGVTALVALPDEGRPVHGGERHVAAADADAPLRVSRLDVELARCLGDLLEHEVGVELDVRAVDRLTGLREHLDRLGQDELHTDLRHDPPPALVQGGDRVLGEDLVPGHPVDEHSPAPLD